MKKKFLMRGMIPVVITVCAYIVMKWVLFIGYVPTKSMEPTIKKGSYIVGTRFYTNLEKGEIIIFWHENNLLVKRIAAVGGERIKKDGEDLTVPDECYYVLGDNEKNSLDSRYWEQPFISEEDIVAKVFFPDNN